MNISVIIPTCEAGDGILTLIGALEKQSVSPDEILVVDSESQDGTADRARMAGARVISVLRSSFDHGGTRDMALRASTGDIVLFLTQDAMPADEGYIERLIAPFSDEKVAAACGRQIARTDARPYEKLFREYRYPQEERIWGKEEISSEGIRAFGISDVCSAYRRSAYEAVGGFEHPLVTNEDMLIAADLLEKGYRLAYCGSAGVWHSHSYTFRQEYRRNVLIGRFLERYASRLHGAAETGEGMRMVRHVLGTLLSRGKLWESFLFCLNCAARLAGSRAGRKKERKAMENSN